MKKSHLIIHAVDKDVHYQIYLISEKDFKLDDDQFSEFTNKVAKYAKETYEDITGDSKL